MHSSTKQECVPCDLYCCVSAVVQLTSCPSWKPFSYPSKKTMTTTCLAPTPHPPTFLTTPRTPARSSTMTVARVWDSIEKFCEVQHFLEWVPNASGRSGFHASIVKTMNVCEGDEPDLQYREALTSLLSRAPDRLSPSTLTCCRTIVTSVDSCSSPSSRPPCSPPEARHWAQVMYLWVVATATSVVILSSTMMYWA